MNSLRKVLLIITGKGSMKDEFMKEVSQSDLKLFELQSIWLESDDYPRLLGAADLGICIHYSSSGYDLSMKVVDMLSAELPVCAVYYPTIRELVKEGRMVTYLRI
jgi:beta-1,4-mannosyltransferase